VTAIRRGQIPHDFNALPRTLDIGNGGAASATSLDLFVFSDCYQNRESYATIHTSPHVRGWGYSGTENAGVDAADMVGGLDAKNEA
jgi:hypothetical protein